MVYILLLVSIIINVLQAISGNFLYTCFNHYVKVLEFQMAKTYLKRFGETDTEYLDRLLDNALQEYEVGRTISSKEV